MASKMMHRRIALRRKLQLLRNVTKSKSVKNRSSILMDAILYIHKLRVQVEEMKKELQHLGNHIQEVKVEKVGAGYLAVRVTCKQSEEMLVSILETFEEMNLNVLQAKITCKHFFGMEAVVKADDHHDIDAATLNQAILKVVRMQTQKCTTT